MLAYISSFLTFQPCNYTILEIKSVGMRALKSIWVDLAEKSYPIFLDDNWNTLFEKARACLENRQGSLKGRKMLIITDENVHELYHNPVKEAFETWGMVTATAVVPPGEASKSLQQAEELYTKALEAGLDRHSLIAALGGGVIGDLAGFTASTYMRGIPFIQIPTSLLAQVDSSIGGKVAVNHPMAKNIIGSFYQPECVLINVSTLRTLPGRESSSGMAELIKHGIIRDEAFLAWLESSQESLVLRNAEVLIQAIHRSCEIKADVVAKDEKETGIRAVLNFGHTVGHAIEAATGYGTYTHGEAVSIGMIAEAYIAQLSGFISPDYISRISKILSRAGLPTLMPDLNSQELLNWMQHDKKNVGSRIVFVLPVAPGKVKVFRDIDTKLVLKALDAARNEILNKYADI